jgi:hypothetical protein
VYSKKEGVQLIVINSVPVPAGTTGIPRTNL